MSLTTLNGHRVTDARVNISAWGAWHASVSIDGEESLSGAVELVLSDLTMKGTVLSGGPAKGRSRFRLVGGAGGWGLPLRRRGYANDAGVRLTTVLGDAAGEVGETLDVGARADERLGPSYARLEGDPASRLLELLAPNAWYIGADGVTRLGRRPVTTPDIKAAHGPVDLAMRCVTLAAESSVDLVPGVMVDGMEAVDVEHEVTPDGLRTTIWGMRGKDPTGGDPIHDALRRIARDADPGRDFRGIFEYRIGLLEGKRLSLQPVRVSTGLPDQRLVRVWPGVGGCDATPELGTRVLLMFIDGSPARPVVVAFEDVDSGNFVPTSINMMAGGMVGGEHVATVEGTVLLLHNALSALADIPSLSVLPAWTSGGVKTALAAGINAALAAQSAPAPTGAAAQAAAAAAQVAAMALGSVGTTTAPYAAAIAGIDGKTANASGLFPALGAKAVKAG